MTTTTRMSPPTSTFLVPEKTYWESLCECDRRGSVNERISRAFGDKIGWGYKGLLQQKWNDEVYPAISLIINHKDNYEKIFRRVSARVTRPCSLYMVTERQTRPDDKLWEHAQPTIVSISSKFKIAQKICNLLKSSACLRNLNLGFDFMCFEDKTLMLTAGDGGKSSIFDHEDSLCGVSFLTHSWPRSPSRFRQATVGGVITIDGAPFILAPAHVFYPNDFDEDDDNDSVSSEGSTGKFYMINSSEASETFVPTSPLLHRVISRVIKEPMTVYQRADGIEEDYLALEPELDSTSLQELGRLDLCLHRQLVYDKGICPELDWALVSQPLNQPCEPPPNTVKTPAGDIVSLDSLSSTSPAGSAVIVVSGSSGVLETRASGRIDGIILPGSMRMQEVWTIDSGCRSGDCGSWVIDAEHGTIYGTIVATSYNAQESYLVPAKDILESLRERWPASNIQFPAVNVEVATKNARIHYKFGKFLVNSMGRYIRRESTPSSPSDFDLKDMLDKMVGNKREDKEPTSYPPPAHGIRRDTHSANISIDAEPRSRGQAAAEGPSPKEEKVYYGGPSPEEEEASKVYYEGPSPEEEKTSKVYYEGPSI